MPRGQRLRRGHAGRRGRQRWRRWRRLAGARGRWRWGGWERVAHPSIGPDESAERGAPLALPPPQPALSLPPDLGRPPPPSRPEAAHRGRRGCASKLLLGRRVGRTGTRFRPFRGMRFLRGRGAGAVSKGSCGVWRWAVARGARGLLGRVRAGGGRWHARTRTPLMMRFAAGGSPFEAVPPAARRHEDSNLDPSRHFAERVAQPAGVTGIQARKRGARPCCRRGKVAEIDEVRYLCERATRGEQAGLTRACEEEAWLPVPGGGASNSAPQRRDSVASSVVDENSTSISARHSLIGSAANENMSWHMPSTCPGTRRCAADGRLKQVVAVASI